jgi:hypothetical protein
MIPTPPWDAIARHIFESETVSIGEETSGVPITYLFVNLDLKSH